MAQEHKTTDKKSTYKKKQWIYAAMSLILLTILCVVNVYYKPASESIDLELPPAEENFESEVPEETNDWLTITTKENDTLSKLFSIAKISPKTLQQILNNNPHAKSLSNIKPGQQIKFLIKNDILEKIIFPLNITEVLIVTHKNEEYLTKIKAKKLDVQEDFVTATIKGSLYATAKNAQIPYKLIQQMTQIFEWDINFAKDIRAGDQFSILYKASYLDDSKVSTGEIVAVEYKGRNKNLQAIAHKDKHGDLNYYTPSGASLKKAFSRYPIKFSHISSPFSTARRHPILKYVRPHKGVDLSASIGTPIHATGDGRIKIIGTNNGYGNMIKIVHNKTYSSIYAHMLRFQKGLSRGNYVKRGQIIGYVGQSGIATGPHCHYEFHVNQRAENPATIKLPQADSVPVSEKNKFKAMANKAIASLNLYTASRIADASNKNKTNTG